MKNLIAAPARRSPPHPAISRYPGSSVASKNRKNSSRSSDTNVPSTNVSSARIVAMSVRTFTVSRNDASTAITNRNVVSRTRNRLMPSTPTAYFSPIDATQVAWSPSW